MSQLQQFARINDVIRVSVRQPQPYTYRMTLATPESCAYANQLLEDPKSGWRLESIEALQG